MFSSSRPKCLLYRPRYNLVVKLWSNLFRATAAFMLLFIAVEMVTCELPGSPCAVVSQDLVSSVQARSSEVPDTVQVKKAVQRIDQTADTDEDNCICCCAHTLVQPALTFAAQPIEATARLAAPTQAPHSRSSDIDHPPQLS